MDTFTSKQKLYHFIRVPITLLPSPMRRQQLAEGGWASRLTHWLRDSLPNANLGAPKPQIPVIAKLQVTICHGPLQLFADAKSTAASTYSLHGYMQRLIIGCLLLFNHCFARVNTIFPIRCSLGGERHDVR